MNVVNNWDKNYGNWYNHVLTVSHMMNVGETKLFASFVFFIPAHFLWVVFSQHQEKVKFSSRLWLGRTQTAEERIFFLLLHHLSGSQNLAGCRWEPWAGKQRQLGRKAKAAAWSTLCVGATDKQAESAGRTQRPNSLRARHTTGQAFTLLTGVFLLLLLPQDSLISFKGLHFVSFVS